MVARNRVIGVLSEGKGGRGWARSVKGGGGWGNKGGPGIGSLGYDYDYIMAPQRSRKDIKAASSLSGVMLVLTVWQFC